MVTQMDDPLMQIAEQVADCLSSSGYAFVEDDKVETLAAVLQTFLTVAGIPTHATSAPLAVGVTPQSRR